MRKGFEHFSKLFAASKPNLASSPDTGTRVLDNTRPFLRSSIVGF